MQRVSVAMHAERDTVVEILSVFSVRLIPVLCLNELTYRHALPTFW